MEVGGLGPGPTWDFFFWRKSSKNSPKPKKFGCAGWVG